MAPHDRQSKGVKLSWSTVVTADAAPGMTYALTSRVTLSQAGSVALGVAEVP